MAKAYPLVIENVGEDTYILQSRGHHDIHEFMRAVRKDYDWPLGVPKHVWMKTRPAGKNSGYTCFYDVVPQGTRGAWPATHVQEAWGEDSYEAHYPAPASPSTGEPSDSTEPLNRRLLRAAQATTPKDRHEQ